jgi:hypothetical protein
MKDAVEEVVEEGRQGAVNVGVLPAFVTKGAGQRSAAVEAIGLVCVPVGPFAGLRLDRPADDPAGDGVAKAF